MDRDNKNPAARGGAHRAEQFVHLDNRQTIIKPQENLAASFKASRNRIPSATGRVVYSSDAIDTWTPISAPTKNIMARLISKMEA